MQIHVLGKYHTRISTVCTEAGRKFMNNVHSTLQYNRGWSEPCTCIHCTWNLAGYLLLLSLFALSSSSLGKMITLQSGDPWGGREQCQPQLHSESVWSISTNVHVQTVYLSTATTRCTDALNFLTRMSPGSPPLVAIAAPLDTASPLAAALESLLTVTMGPAVAVPRVAAPAAFWLGWCLKSFSSRSWLWMQDRSMDTMYMHMPVIIVQAVSGCIVL